MLIKDQSTNGTFLNGSSQRVHQGQPFRVGDTLHVTPPHMSDLYFCLKLFSLNGTL